MTEGNGAGPVDGAETNTPKASLEPNPAGAVFVSYASQDASAAARIAGALRAAGIEVWFDQSELRGGDAWDQSIRKQIKTCALFLPVISRNTHDRDEGYFRLEWKLAVDRCHLMAADRTFLLPVVIDDTRDADERVPERFREVQWTRLTTGVNADAFVERVRRLLSRDATTPGAASARSLVLPSASTATASTRLTAAASRSSVRWVVGGFLFLAVGYIAFDKVWLDRRDASDKATTTVNLAAPISAPKTPVIPERSVAVLPFTDMSEKKDQEYFSDGMTEEIIDLLVKVPELKVPARTSSFYFKGKPSQVPDIAKALGVAHILEGSVRKVGNQVRVTVQLVQADNGYHIWSETYDRPVNDVFKMQDEIAGAVVSALKVSLLKGEAPNAQLTNNSEAYEFFLQARAQFKAGSINDSLKAYSNLQRAVSLDPNFAFAWASLAMLLTDDTVDWTRVFNRADATLQSKGSDEDWGTAWTQARSAAHAAAKRAIEVGPDLGRTHLAMAVVLATLDWDWPAADAELKRARSLDPGDARITAEAARIAINLGREPEGLQLAERATTQDPLGAGMGLVTVGQYVSGSLDQAQESARKFISLYPTSTASHFNYALVLLARGEPQAALSELEREDGVQFLDVYRPIALDALGRHTDADRAMALAEQKWANGMAYNIAGFYGARNDADRAMYWLERAYRQHDDGLEWLKIDPLLKPLRNDPRYKALLHKLKFTD